MKFNYEYRTSDNKLHGGVVCAASREDAFTALKARGINPARVVEAPGFFNKLFGKGKRWIAIGVLAFALALALAALVLRRGGAEPPVQGYDELDPSVIKRFEELGHDSDSIRELVEARKRLNDEFRARIAAQVKDGTMTKKDADDLLNAIGLKPLE